MPVIQITLLSGRTTEQKRRIAERITEVMMEEAKAPRDGVVITFLDVSEGRQAEEQDERDDAGLPEQGPAGCACARPYGGEHSEAGRACDDHGGQPGAGAL